MSRLPTERRDRAGISHPDFVLRRGRKVAARVAMALTLIGVTFDVAASGAGPAGPPPRQTGPCDIYAAAGTPAWPRTAPRARCTPPTTARSTRSCASRTARPWTSASSSPRAGPDAGGYANAAAQDAFCANTTCWITTHLRPVRQAQPPHPGAPRRIQRPGHGRLQQPPDRRHGADHDQRPQGLRRLHRAGHGPPQQRRQGHRGRRPGRRAVLGHQRPRTTTAAAASTTATPRPTAATTATAPWRPPTSATPPPGIAGTGTGPWIMTDQENNLVGCVNPAAPPNSAPTCRASPGGS